MHLSEVKTDFSPQYSIGKCAIYCLLIIDYI